MSVRPAVIAMALTLILGCSGGDDGSDAVSQAPADVSGRWAFEVQATSTTCSGASVPAGTGTGYLVITQAGPAIAVEHLDRCGQAVYSAPGTVNGQVAVVTQSGTVCSDPLCCYDVSITETLARSGDTLGGDIRIAIDAQGCATMTSCDYNGTVTAEMCGAGECESYPPDCP
jgi:hypothetical protein